MHTHKAKHMQVYNADYMFIILIFKVLEKEDTILLMSNHR